MCANGVPNSGNPVWTTLLHSAHAFPKSRRVLLQNRLRGHRERNSGDADGPLRHQVGQQVRGGLLKEFPWGIIRRDAVGADQKPQAPQHLIGAHRPDASRKRGQYLWVPAESSRNSSFTR